MRIPRQDGSARVEVCVEFHLILLQLKLLDVASAIDMLDVVDECIFAMQSD